MTASGIVVLAHTAAAWFGAGFIWTMQVLNYPLLAEVGSDSFVGYERAHNRRFVRVVGPTVVVLAVTTVLLFLSRPLEIPLDAAVVGATLVLAILVLTAAFQAPAHGQLARGFEARVHATLVRGSPARRRRRAAAAHRSGCAAVPPHSVRSETVWSRPGPTPIAETRAPQSSSTRWT